MRYFNIAMGLVLSSLCLAQTEVDSLKSVIAQSEGTHKVELQFKLGNLLININPDEAEALAHVMLTESDEIDYTLGRSKAYFIAGACYNIRSELDTAIHLFERSLALAETSKDDTQITLVGMALGANYLRQYQLNQALKSFQKVINSARLIENQGLELTALMNEAVVYTYLKEADLAEANLNQALEIARTIDNKLRTAQIYGNLGNLEFDRSNFSLSRGHFEKALDLLKELGAQQMMGIVYTLLGRCHFELGNAEKALEEFDLAFGIREASGDTRGMASVIRYKSKGLLELDRLSEAEGLLEEALKMNESVQDPFISMDLAETGYLLFERKRNYQKALAFHKEYLVFKDTIEARNERQEVKRLTAEYDYNQLNQQLAQERQEKEIAELKKSQRSLWLVILVISLLGLVIIYLVNRSRHRKQLIINEQERALLSEQLSRQSSRIDEMESELSSLEAEYTESAETKRELIQYLEGAKVEGKDWASFKLLFEKVYPGALANLQDYQLTLNDQRLVALTVLGLSIKEIASVLGITPKSVSKARTRLTAKLSLADTKNLDQFVFNLIKIQNSPKE